MSLTGEYRRVKVRLSAADNAFCSHYEALLRGRVCGTLVAELLTMTQTWANKQPVRGEYSTGTTLNYTETFYTQLWTVGITN